MHTARWPPGSRLGGLRRDRLPGLHPYRGPIADLDEPRTMSTTIAFVGPLPPPVHGFSNICAAMLKLLATRSPVIVFDRAPNQRGFVRSVANDLQLLGRYVLHSVQRSHTDLYLALSGGQGQFKDLPYLLIAKMFGQRVFVHHHSFSYIDAPTLLNRVVFAFLRNAQHIALSRHMAEALCRVYGLPSDRVRVISNAAFYESPLQRLAARNESGRLRIGYLSAVSEAKGIAQFFQVLESLHGAGVAYEGKIAGPVEPGSKAQFDTLLAAAHEVTYCGPLYDQAKQDFYDSLDVLMFPTNYPNEAEPLVIHEAMRRGVHVLACKRGAIGEILGNGAGEAVSRDHFVDMAVGRIREFDADRGALRRAQAASFEQARRLRAVASTDLGELLSDMSGSTGYPAR